jgi:hypothetical protein
MGKRNIPTLLRQILRASISAPVALASAGCGGGADITGTCFTAPIEGGAPNGTGADAGAACLRYALRVTGAAAACGLFPISCNGPFTQTAPALCATLCQHEGASCWLGSNNSVSCVVGECLGGTCCGRRPPGLKLEVASGRSEIGRWFAELAAREAASVEAFAILGAELALHRAPGRLRESAERAARDEIRHARVMSARIAIRRQGASAPIRARTVRSLKAIATENAVEGCVSARWPRLHRRRSDEAAWVWALPTAHISTINCFHGQTAPIDRAREWRDHRDPRSCSPRDDARRLEAARPSNPRAFGRGGSRRRFSGIGDGKPTRRKRRFLNDSA